MRPDAWIFGSLLLLLTNAGACWLDWSPRAGEKTSSDLAWLADAPTAQEAAPREARPQRLEVGAKRDAAAGDSGADVAAWPDVDAREATPPGADLGLAADSAPALPDASNPPDRSLTVDIKKPQGSDCSQAAECASGTCASGTCCNRPCTHACESCRLAGSRGSCTVLPAGAAPSWIDGCPADPPSSCGLDGFCDGQGTCRRWSAATRCQEATCVSGGRDGWLNLGSFCNGAGDCVSTGEQSCAPYACEVAKASCYATCTGKSKPLECVKDASCNKGECKGGDDDD